MMCWQRAYEKHGKDNWQKRFFPAADLPERLLRDRAYDTPHPGLSGRLGQRARKGWRERDRIPPRTHKSSISRNAMYKGWHHYDASGFS